jgi:hypothetical protein
MDLCASINDSRASINAVCGFADDEGEEATRGRCIGRRPPAGRRWYKNESINAPIWYNTASIDGSVGSKKACMDCWLWMDIHGTSLSDVPGRYAGDDGEDESMSDGPIMKGVAGSGLTLVSALGGKNASEKAKFIPLRVSGEERVYLRLLEGALDVSEYTDNVDIVRGFSFRYQQKHP